MELPGRIKHLLTLGCKLLFTEYEYRRKIDQLTNQSQVQSVIDFLMKGIKSDETINQYVERISTTPDVRVTNWLLQFYPTKPLFVTLTGAEIMNTVYLRDKTPTVREIILRRLMRESLHLPIECPQKLMSLNEYEQLYIFYTNPPAPFRLINVSVYYPYTEETLEEVLETALQKL